MNPIKIVTKNGTERWKLTNGLLHREDGPAIIHPSGRQEWYLNGKWHRTDGPAIDWPNGRQEWWINSNEYTEQEFKDKMDRIKDLEETLKGITT